jgi:hypothetical protein
VDITGDFSGWYDITCPFCEAAGLPDVIIHLLLPAASPGVLAWVRYVIDGHLASHVEEMVEETLDI